MNHFTQPSSGQHWGLLDGLRGLAILMVVACHGFYVNPNGPGWLVVLGNFIAAGAIGVQMFFVLSGFLIAYPFLKAKQNESQVWYRHGYATRRCLKIIPPYMLCILLLSGFYVWRDGNTELLKTGLLWATGFPHLFYVENAFEFNGSFWSLWVEVGFYLLLPGCFFCLRKKSAMFSAVAISAVLLVGSLASSFVTWPDSALGRYFYIYLNGRFPNSLSNFAFGVLFAGIFVTSRNNRAFLRAARKIGCLGVPALLAALAWQVWTGRGSLFGEWAAFELGILLAGGATFLLLFFLMDTTTPGARLLSMPWLQYLGVVSYEWFLLHQPVIRACRKQANGAHGSLLVYFVIVVLPMVATLVAAVLINRFISLPIIEWGRARFSRTHPPRALSSSIPPNTSN